MTTAGKLFLSFWKLSLKNLPVGRLVHRILDAAEAKLLIEQTQQNHSLVCVSSDDLFAPYNGRILKNQRELCQVLQEHFGIEVVIEDFFSSSLADGEELCSVVPLELVRIQDNDSLMIVSCHYSLPESRTPGTLEF
ncbi:MAG: hypothetical protein IGS48_18435 [Oscillatoriales cyanobacterium C42_A2020_001]|nr:hypothetical protein [Leptolyngbyaceae cyanobacterium C42_A2020_001]